MENHDKFTQTGRGSIGRSPEYQQVACDLRDLQGDLELNPDDEDLTKQVAEKRQELNELARTKASRR